MTSEEATDRNRTADVVSEHACQTIYHIQRCLFQYILLAMPRYQRIKNLVVNKENMNARKDAEISIQ